MKICGSGRPNWTNVTVVLMSAHVIVFVMFCLSNPKHEVSDDTLVHQMFQDPLLTSVNQSDIEKALMKAKENVLKELRHEVSQSGKHQSFILPTKKRFILIFSHWRSGSTFIYDLINSFPATYGYFEPLLPILTNHYDPLKQRNSSLRAKLKSLIKDNFVCNIESGKKNYFELIAKKFLNLDKRVQKACATRVLPPNATSCYNPRLHQRMCQSMTVVVQKLVRLESGFIPELLEDTDLNLKIVVLMRDPRAVMMSRKEVEFCGNSATCSNASFTCEEMERTIDQVVAHQPAYPDSLYFVRYEDLVSNLMEVTEDMFAFLDLPVTNSVLRFLQTHTKLTSDTGVRLSMDSYSTYRNSAQMLNSWREMNSFKDVWLVQRECEKVLRKLNYTEFVDSFSYKNTNTFSFW